MQIRSNRLNKESELTFKSQQNQNLRSALYPKRQTPSS